MPVFYIASPRLEQGILTITGPLVDHLKKSLRVRLGEEITVGDHRVRRAVRIVSLAPTQIRAEVIREEHRPASTAPSLTLAQAILKGDRMEWVIQKATELGVDRLVPLVTDRGIVRPRPERQAHHQERWERIALEAAQQSERWDVPTVEMSISLNQWLATAPDACQLILAERSTHEPLVRVPLPHGPEGRIALVVGPEGGWSDVELRSAVEAGARPVSLGNLILRAETAAMAAMAVVQSRLGGLG